MRIEPLSADDARAAERSLADLLVDAVDSGASVGFLPPLGAAEAAAYWRSVADAVTGGSLVLLAARDAEGVAGSAQLDLALRANGLHRAEVAKVMVHRRARRQGLGRALMLAAEGEARRRGRTTLVLDTRQGDPSEILYRSLGWQLAGTIPRYAKSADGTLHTTAFYFKLLETPSSSLSPLVGERAG
jgi:ribosomal protein S18 acetylase RimI-like enzyme